MGPDAAPAPAVRVPWDRLRAWIDAHEDYERRHRAPAPLAQAEMEALSVLVPFGEEPDVDRRNHVGELMETAQSRQLPLPTFADEPVDVPAKGRIQLMWRCVCSLGSHGSFPREGYGADAHRQPPAFQSKKNAKQYAAKHALAYIKCSLPDAAAKLPATEQSSSGSPARPPRPAPKAQVDRCRPHAAADGPGGGGGGGGGDPASPASTFKRVNDLSARLGLDTPTYRIERDAELVDFFSGRAVFRTGCAPPDVGAVRGVLGKKETKEQVAERTLEWLLDEERRRDALVQSLWPARS